MKNVLIFIAGIITGVVLMCLLILANGNVSGNNGVTLFEEEGECISENSFRVFQVSESGDALAQEIGGPLNMPTGLVVLLLCEDGKSYYDDQIIRTSSAECAKQIGVFRYTTKEETEKTVPIVRICSK